MRPSPTDAVNKLTTIFLIVDQSFYNTIAKILSSPAFLSEAVENTTLATSIINIGIIDN